MRIAVVGSGISGLTAAWLLHRQHEVVLFESEDRPGGHTHTHEVTVDGQDLAVDTGFIVFNDRNYPTFERLIAELGVAGRPTQMTFSVTNQGTGLEYSGDNLDTLFAQRRNLLNPAYIGMLLDILRFNRNAPRLLSVAGPGPTLGRHLSDAGYSASFIRDYLIPMGAAIWSVPTDQMEQFPAKRMIEFFRNHGLLTINDRPQWHVVEGGSRAYMDVILEALGPAVRLGEAVREVRRAEPGIELRTDASSERFDEVVFACHSDQALAALGDPSPQEREILGAMRYQENEVVLHTDAGMLPECRKVWAAWNYRLPAAGAEDVTVSYWMNLLQHLPVTTPVVVTLNQTAEIDEQRILKRLQYAHPIFDAPAVAAQGRRDEISGVRNTWYCGAYWRYGFHEDGCLSAVEVARGLGVDW